MTFDEVLAQVRELLQNKGRVAYRALKRRFELDDEYLEDLKAELIDAEHVACDEDGKVLVWAQEQGAKSREHGAKHQEEARSTSQSASLAPRSLLTASQAPAAERRQLTVMFIDLVGSTTLSQQLDPEDYHARVVAYQTACQRIIARYEGHIAQYLGDGVLVYFGYPVAHEEDAVRAVRSSLEIITAVRQLAYTPPLQVRIGIHTGPVVVGEIGAGEHTERLALGETPNIAARVQGMAEPDTVVMSAATSHLVHGLFEYQDLGPQTLKGIATPLSLYRIIGESSAQSRFEVAVRSGLTPFIGREAELAVLRQHWEQARAGNGQVVLISGEPGIGKSRLVQEFKEQLGRDGVTRLEFRCSPYHQNSALYPIIDHLQRLLQFTREDSPSTKLEKLQHTLSRYRFPQADTLPLLAALLSLPHPEGSPPITVSPQKQKEKTQAALVAWLIEEAAQNTVYNAWEDLHWADPSTLEVFTLLLDQVPTTRLLAVLTFRPEFTPPWGNRSHLNQLTLRRLGQPQVKTMVEQVTRGKALPGDVLHQIIAKTDGVPLFVEEVTKSVVEAVGMHASALRHVGIPATLQDALMARLDRLGTAKEIAQLGATLGREFPYELLHAISPFPEDTLQQELKHLVAAELVYQRGLLPHATYMFKHALIQDIAYQSLLKSERQHVHQHVAQVLVEQFPETLATQPELVAQHYTEAGLIEHALPYWQRAGERASQHSAYVEAVAHLTKGLELLKLLPGTPTHVQQELMLQITLGTTLLVTKGYTASEVEHSFARALELCQQLGETPHLFLVLGGLYTFHFLRAELGTAHELAEQQLRLAQNIQDPALLLWPHVGLGLVLCNLGESRTALGHLEQGLTLYDLLKHRPDQSKTYGQDPKVTCLCYVAVTLWTLGYADQARRRISEALTHAQALAHPFSVAFALNLVAALNQFLRDGQAVQEQTEALVTLAHEQGFPHWLALGAIRQGWALAEQGQGKEGVRRMHQGKESLQAMGATLNMPLNLAWLAEGYGKTGQAEEGLTLLAEAWELIQRTGERRWEAELYRLKGELTLQSKVQGLRSKVEEEAEGYFLKAITIARKQQAKSLELRAVMSLVRLRQQQALEQSAKSKEVSVGNIEQVSRNTQHVTRTTLNEAHRMLSEVYNWFTEGFDTLDLKEAKALLESLESRVKTSQKGAKVL